MSRSVRLLFAPVIVAILIGGSLLPGLIGTSEGFVKNEGTLTKTKEGWTDLNLTWDTSSVAKPLTMNLSLNKGWSIDSATVGINSKPFVTDIGTQWQATNYPERPRLDVGRNGDDWVWPGTFGHQAQFANESDSESLDFGSRDTKTLLVPLPVGANIQDMKFEVNNSNSGQYSYSMTVGSGHTIVWEKDSINYTKGPFISTKDSLGNEVSINSVCSDHLDFLFDTYKDIVAVGKGGKFYTVLHDRDQPTGYNLNPPAQVLSSADLLDCSLSDYNQDITNELAVSTADGKIYILNNNGVGNFILPPITIDPGQTSAMGSVSFGDVNNDGWGDVVGGYIRGQFFVSTYNNTKSKFNAPYEVKAGTGSMNGVQIVDLDLNGKNDLAGASNDRNWWTVNNTGNSTSPWQEAKPVPSKGSDLTSLVVADFNFDNSPDLVSGSQDGSFYVAYNIGGNLYDQPQALRGGLESMKDIAAGDLDLDGDVDVLGLNADGWIYSAKNEFGSLQEGKKVLNVGLDKNTLTLADLNNDNALDLILGGINGVTIYYSTLGPFKETLGSKDNGLFAKEVQKYLDNFHGTENDKDPYGNLIVDVPIKIFSLYPRNLKFGRVNVTYTYEAKVDVQTALSLYVKANQDKANAQGFVDVPIQFMTDSVGTLRISDISIHHSENLIAYIEVPSPGQTFNMSTMVPLKGHSNYDADCKNTSFEYTWLVDGRTLGTGCQFNGNPRTDLGGVGSHNLRLLVKYTPTGETTYANVLINLVPDLSPNLNFKVQGPEHPKIKANRNLQIDFNATAFDPSLQNNITFRIISGPPGAIINRTTGVFEWKPTKDQAGTDYAFVVQASLNDYHKNVTVYITVESTNAVAVPVCLSWPVIAMVLIVCVAFGIVIAGTEVGVFALYSLAFLMYTRLRSEMVLDNFLRGQIYGHICENPGLHLNELKKKLELPNGTLVYHLRTLEREGLIKSYQNGSGRVFYSSKVKVSKELIHLTKAQKWILQLIKERPGLSQKEISKETGLSDSTVNRIVHDLKEQGMVRMNKGKSTSWFIVDETCIFLWPVQF
jgi:predicted transcriptional regulator